METLDTNAWCTTSPIWDVENEYDIRHSAFSDCFCELVAVRITHDFTNYCIYHACHCNTMKKQNQIEDKCTTYYIIAMGWLWTVNVLIVDIIHLLLFAYFIRFSLFSVILLLACLNNFKLKYWKRFSSFCCSYFVPSSTCNKTLKHSRFDSTFCQILEWKMVTQTS